MSATSVFGGVFSLIVFDNRLISCGAIPQSRTRLKSPVWTNQEVMFCDGSAVFEACIRRLSY